VSLQARCPICGGDTREGRQGLYDDRYGYPGHFASRACTECGHGFLDAEFSTEQLTELYSRYYPRGSFEPESLQPPAEASGLTAYLDGARASAFRWVPRRVRVLDIGCGFGETLIYHRRRDCEAFGIDADENILRVGERYSLNVRAGLFEPGLYEPSSFDFVTLDQVIEHQRDPLTFMAGVASVVRPGGFIVVSTPNAHGVGARVFGRRWINWHVPYHLQQFCRRSLSELAGRAGLRIDLLRTITSSAWWRFQFLHLATCPRPAESSPFWDETRAQREMPRGVIRASDVLWRLKLPHAAARLTDAAGVGDNFVCLLRRPA
jgi:2-polyprenyl-3-methyl-5-hydroxy-6-metoxy-1,4-benzoquinol methylase